MRLKRGQSALEYAILMVVIAAALVGMFSYIRSAMSSQVKSGADGIGKGLVYH